jgi:peptidoglycan hydrolase-like protein with peptidoglycan-binding domain
LEKFFRPENIEPNLRGTKSLLQRAAGGSFDGIRKSGVQAKFTVQRQSSEDLLGEPPPSSDLPPPDQRRMIRIGSQGREVSYGQERLNAHRATPPLVVDGIFGSLTRKATLGYQNTHGLVNDAIIGPRTWASLDGPTVVGGKSGGGQSGGGGPNTGTTLKYDTTAHSISPPPKGETLANIKAALQAKQDKKPEPDLGKTLNVKGVNPGTDEELFVWNVMLQLANHENWGSEVDVVTDIGRPTKPGNKAPVGQITLRIDNQGNATAELLNRGAVVIPTKSQFASMDDVKKLLKSQFNLADIKDDGTATWKQEELNKVHAALSRLPAPDREALAGVELIRTQEIILNGEKLSGEFSHSSNLPQGATSATRSESIKISDLAFAGDDISFVGDKGDAAAASFQTILHEVGHAVEAKALLDAEFATAQASGKVNQKQNDLATKQQAFNETSTAFTTASEADFKKTKGYDKTQQKGFQPFFAAINGATTAIGAFGNNNNSSQQAKLEAAASSAIQKRDDQKTKLASASPTHPALTDFADTLKSQNDMLAAAKDRANAQTNLEVAKSELTTKQSAQNAVTGSNTPKRSKRLTNFVKFVNKNKIPPLTEYANKNWPAHPEEFFAEAYSLWLSDRTYLEANAKPLVDWFNSGEHLK